MSDAHTRDLGRRLEPGDTRGLEALILELKRKGDQAGLCELGHHDLDASVPDWAQTAEHRESFDPPRDYIWTLIVTRPTATCAACEEVVPVYWVADMVHLSGIEITGKLTIESLVDPIVTVGLDELVPARGRPRTTEPPQDTRL